MADTVSAATLVGAVLEQAGYVSQSGLLDGFDDFFLSGGRLLYLLAAVGALTSVAMLGSAKMVRYLLIGPILFWFLVIPRSEVDGVLWQVNGDQKQIGDADAKEVVDAVNLNTEAPRISTVFKIYVSFVSNIISESVRVITAQIEKQDAFFTDRATALHAIINSRISNPTLLGLYDNLLWGKSASDPDGPSPCADLMIRALAGAPTEMGEGAVNQLESNLPLVAASAALQGDFKTRFEKIQSNREEFEKSYALVEKNAMVMPNDSMRSFLKQYRENPTLQPLYQKAVVESQPMTCREVWNTIAVGAQMEAENIWNDLSKSYEGKWKQAGLSENELAENRKELCRDISRKMGAEVGDGEECSMVPLIFTHMMRNAAAPDHLSRILNRHKERGAFIRFDNEAGLQAQGVEDSAMWTPRMKNGQPIVQHLYEGVEVPEAQLDNYDQSKLTKKYLFDSKKGGEESKYLEAAQLMDAESQFANAFGKSLNFRLEEIRNSLFAFSMELPYWQGVILYLVAFLYPLWAFVVLVPGRAVNFFRLPLFWLWAKSWDVGFAFAMVFERVLWNLFPTHTADSRLQVTVTSPEEIKSLVAFYADGIRLDPSYHIYTYYWALSMVVLAIPGLTGAAILKGQRAALSSFSEAAGKMASLVGSRGAGAYGMLQMNHHVLGARHTMGMAKLGSTSNSGSLGSWLGNESSAAAAPYGVLGAGSALMKSNMGAAATGAAAFGGAVLANSVLNNKSAAAGGEESSLNGGELAAAGAEGGGNGGNKNGAAGPAAVAGGAASSAPAEGTKPLASLGNFELTSDEKVIASYAILGNVVRNNVGNELIYDPSVDLGGKAMKTVGNLTYVSQGLKAFKDVYEADFHFRSEFDRVFGSEGGRYRSERVFAHEAVLASMDPNGGFEMNDYGMNLLKESTTSFQTKSKALFGVLKSGMIGGVKAVPFLPDSAGGFGLALGGLGLSTFVDDADSSMTDPMGLLTGDQPYDVNGVLLTPMAYNDYRNAGLMREPQASDMSILGNMFMSPVYANVSNYDKLDVHMPELQGSEINSIFNDPNASVEELEQGLIANIFKRGTAASIMESLVSSSNDANQETYQQSHSPVVPAVQAEEG